MMISTGKTELLIEKPYHPLEHLGIPKQVTLNSLFIHSSAMDPLDGFDGLVKYYNCLLR